MLAVQRIDHVSMAAPDWRQQHDFLRDLFGFSFVKEIGPAELKPFGGCSERIYGTDIGWEVITPDPRDPTGGFIQKFLDERGGMHHIAVEVKNVDEAVVELERLGLEPFGGISEDGDWRMAYIHPKDSSGILWQLYHLLRPDEPQPKGEEPTQGAVGYKRMDHVSMAVADLDAQIAWQERVLGMKVEARWQHPSGDFRGCTMSIPGTKLEFEIMTQTEKPSFITRFLEDRGPGLHHVCSEVESMDRAVAALRERGIEPHGGVRTSDWKYEVFIHPRDGGGVLFQLYEVRGDGKRASERSG